MSIINLQSAISVPPATTSSNGLMTASDKLTLNNLVTTISTSDAAAQSITLSNNTIYELTASALTSLTILGVDSGFLYASIIFTSGDTDATQFSVPEDGSTASEIYRCIGVDCSNGSFIPVKGKRYTMAVQQEYDRVAIYIIDAT